MSVTRSLLLVLAVAVLAITASLRAQSLGDVAAREKAKREQKAGQEKAAGKVYTNADLGEAGKTPESGASGSEDRPYVQEQSGYRSEEEGPPSASSEGQHATEENDSEEASWRQRAVSARGSLTQAEGRLAQAEAQIASIREQLSPLRMGGPEQDTNKLLALQEELTQAENERAAARSAVEETRQAWQGFLEEARRSGVPPRWLEEASH